MFRAPSLPALLSLGAVALLTACPGPEQPPWPVRDCRSALRFEPNASVEEVRVKGEWNAFASQPMTKQEDGTYLFEAELSPRAYGYSLEVAGQEQLDPENPYTRWVANQEYSRLTVEDCAQPLLTLTSYRYDVATRSVELSAQFVAGKDQHGPNADTASLIFDGVKVDSVFDPKTARFTWSAQAIAPGKHNVRVNVQDREGRATNELYLPFWVEQEPFDWQEAILYFAFTDRFRNGNPANDAPVDGVDPQANYLGGDFAGITQALEEGYFESLGVKAIWLSPVVANPDGSFGGTHGKLYTGYHGYWPSQARQTQSRFGSLEELRALTRAAHDRGIRVITDLVINHVHDQHPYFAEHKDDGWFNVGNACVCGVNNCDWEARRLDCWFTSYLPDLNWRSTQLTDQMVDDALFWLKEADLDGFRLDAVKHLDHVAGRTLAGKLEEITSVTGTEFYLVGETFTGSDGRALIAEYVSPTELDGQFDFPLYWPIVDSFARGQSLKNVDDAVLANEAFYQPWVLNSPFIGNHDVPRFISIAANQIEADSGGQAWGANKPPATVTDDLAFTRARDALTFALTLPGVPLIYYGDELGLPGTGDPDNRRLMKWGSALSPREASLLEHVRKVGQARAKNRGLRYGARYTLSAEADLLVYQRDDSAGSDGALVTIHRGAQERSVQLALRGRLKSAEGLVLKDVISGRTATVQGGAVALPLPGQHAGVWVPAE